MSAAIPVDSQAIGNWIQAGTGVVAVLAAGAALLISKWDREKATEEAAKDRAAAKAIAAADRSASIRQARLLFELDAVKALLENLNRGGSSDSDEASRMGAESLTLIGLLGRERVPDLWDARVQEGDAGLLRLTEDPDMPDFKKDAIRAQLAANAIIRDIGVEIRSET